MEEKDEESASFDGSAYILTFESLKVSLQRNESISVIDQRQSGSYKSTERVKSSCCKGGCSKSCTEYRKTSWNGPQTSDREPQTLRESFYRQKKPETKPAAEVPLFGQLKTKMKETSRKLQETTRRTAARARSLYDRLRPWRVLGFKCDVKKCDSTLMGCSAGACRKKSMIFGEPSRRPCGSKTADSCVSDTSTLSSTSEDTVYTIPLINSI
ncbi:PREDICTED: uncharacterized protein LOC105452870 isoform X2 [Wasmannia auropunctata]|uniref:uncharacterized protein LOC105452870 isoform X2 n=1 Tax=Wasmannia auropunctata TaxID=64793 RepID=UPI0005F0AF9B|nr:PREDICTED: uncharacterized protein LOC105452870 isoform X2 [Wasmannia auropunctata]